MYLLKPKTRKLQLFGSLLLLPFGLLDIWFRPNYWNPPLLIKAIEPLSLETFLFCFAAGGIAIVFGSFFIKNKDFKMQLISYKKLMLFFSLGFGIYALFDIFTDFAEMNNLNYSFLIIWIFLLVLNLKENWKSLIPALIFAIFTIIAVNLGLIFYPSFVAQYWNLKRMWPLFMNTPLEEVFFGGILTALWILLPKYLYKNRCK